MSFLNQLTTIIKYIALIGVLVQIGEEYIGGRTSPHLGDINPGAEGQHGPIYGGSADDKNRFLTGNSCKGFPRAVDNPGSGNFRISPGED